MKKFGMLFSTIAVVLITLSTYIYQNTGIAQVNYNYPNIHIESPKYGSILNMQLIGFDKESVLFLTEESPLTNESALYVADLENRKVQSLTAFEKHKNLKDILYLSYNCNECYTASPYGIQEIHLVYNSEKNKYDAKFFPCGYSIPDFNDAISVSCLGSTYYTKANDRYLYVSKSNNYGMFSFSTLNTNNTSSKYNISPQNVFINPYNRSIYYTKLDKNGLNLYEAILPQNGIGIQTKLVIKNIVYPRFGESCPDFIALVKTQKGYGIYVNGKILDEIPSETNILSQLPDVQFTKNDGIGSTAYMKFNPNHKGSIILSNHLDKTEVVKDAPVIGQLRFSPSGKSLMYFTLENNKVMVKLYNIKYKTTRDITDMFY